LTQNLAFAAPAAQAASITGATFILMYKKQDNAAAGQLDYVPMPAKVKDMVRKAWSKQIAGADGKTVYASR
jgi:phosphate transport system substrate-binding protein